MKTICFSSGPAYNYSDREKFRKKLIQEHSPVSSHHHPQELSGKSQAVDQNKNKKTRQ